MSQLNLCNKTFQTTIVCEWKNIDIHLQLLQNKRKKTQSKSRIHRL